MKLSRILGVTGFVAGAALIAAYVSNETRMENSRRLLWAEDFVRYYNPEKYNELKNNGVQDLDNWLKVEAEVRDSVQQARIKEAKIQKSYFEGGQKVRQ